MKIEEERVAYTGFAEVYDQFMDNVPYGEWAEYLAGLLKEYGCANCLLVDLGCGTGSLTELLDDAGYDMIGIDNSEEMLDIAMEKRAVSGKNILYLLQDMRAFELYGTVGGIVSICDSMNYITEYEDLVKVMKLVNNYLDPGGVFIFDLNTEYKYQELLGDRTIAENREEASFIWDNYYDRESRINEYELAVFVKADEEEPLYYKYEEVHYQKAYRLEEIRRAAKEAGLIWEACYEAFTKEEPKTDSERVYVVLREHGKKPDQI